MPLVLALLFAAPVSTDGAAQAFARGDYALAEKLALEEAGGAGSHPGASLYLAGLARFRGGDARGALELLDKSWDASDRPPAGAFRFNRASCLYELGDFAAAERDYVSAAALDSSLAAVALIDAGFAALDGGSVERARELAARAGADPSLDAKAQPLLDDLQAHLKSESQDRFAAEYVAALAEFDAGNFASARTGFLAACALQPDDGRCRIMSGASALRMNLREEARADLKLALTLKLSEDEAQIARDYLETISYGMAARAVGWAAGASVFSGYDSNALQTGSTDSDQRTGATSSSTPSAFATLDLSLTKRFRPADRFTAELGYAFDQLLYAATDASDRSTQEHTLLGSLEWAARDDLRFGASLGAQLTFTGVDDFRGLQLNGVFALWTALDEAERTTTRLELGYEPKAGLAEFDYLSGNRFDASISQEVRAQPVTFTLGYRFRAELIGIASEAIPPPPMGQRGCGTTMVGCTELEPFGYTSSTGWLSLHAAAGTRWSFDAGGGLEWRSYTADNVLIDSVTGQTINRTRRHDTRGFADLSATFWLQMNLALTARYDLVISRSDIDDLGPGDELRSYDKHVFSLGAALSW